MFATGHLAPPNRRRRLQGALHALRDHPLPTLTILPVLLAGAAYAADALFSADLLRVVWGGFDKRRVYGAEVVRGLSPGTWYY